ncbi:alpha/beta hydrolase [Mycobacterium sp. IDR2000157661]|uniref:alpha/beta hydrolase n=1 Tax=Mycobacterium sp. IDR2000157661 TaxID=2867005 RepID=UPI001EEA899C|nr:alpha/beta hydrolase [Mycobacterium sp. IDR2000157661]ULE33920.1 alpha/beta hydrolase [Mycobacterium sp. IDR2000157661]
MVDRFLVWVSAGVITAGMSAAMVAGAGVAIADDASSAGGQGSSESSETRSAVGNDTDSTVGNDTKSTVGIDGDSAAPTPGDTQTEQGSGTDEEKSGEEPVEEEPADSVDEDTENAAGETETTADAEGRPVERVTENNDIEKNDSDSGGTDRVTVTPAQPEPTTAPQYARIVAVEPETETVVEKDQQAEIGEPAGHQRMTVVIDNAADAAETPEVQAVAFAAAPTAAVNATATAPQIPGIIRVIGTIVFNLYGMATRLLGGPPILPANSTVTVRSSSLVLNCGCDDGDTIEVTADWYVPKAVKDQPPERLIYLQHGFLASGPWYSHTAAALAEQTNSIVVAPSITSNFLAADACWLGAAPMHEAIASLFDEGNPALANSALAAGYSGPVPDRVVLMGHSLGGGAVSGAAGFMAQDSSIDRLAGVVLLDGVGLEDGAMALSLDDVPDTIPIYQLAAPKYFWNQFGVGSAALQQARPNAFIGVTLVDGAHVDTMRGGNPLIQFAQQLVSGFSKPRNVVAAERIMVGWVNDMFAGTQDQGVYLDPGQKVSIDTPRGDATAVALPNSLTKWFPLNFLQPFVALGNWIFTFEPICVAASMGVAGGCEDSIAA